MFRDNRRAFSCLLLNLILIPIIYTSSFAHDIPPPPPQHHLLPPIHYLQNRLPHVHPARLHAAVYVLHPTGHLISPVTTHTIPLTHTHEYIIPSVPMLVDDMPSHTGEALIRKSSNTTFVYDAQSMRLVAAWGDSLLLHPLILPQWKSSLPMYINTLFDTNVHNKTITTLPMPQNLHRSSRPIVNASTMIHKRSTRDHYLGIIAVFDKTYCHLFNTPEDAGLFITARFRDAGRTFRPTSVLPRVYRIISTCDANVTRFPPPPNLNECLRAGVDCSPSSLILDSIRKNWRDTPHLSRLVRNAVVAFTHHYDHNSTDYGRTAVGAAYVGSACNEVYGYAWVHGDYATNTVLAHEIAHLLGAMHTEDGLMQSHLPSLLGDKPPPLSAQSIAEIDAFVDTMWDSWCLKPRKRDTITQRTLIPVKLSLKEMAGTGIAIAEEVSGSDRTDLFIVFASMASHNYGSLFYSMVSNVRMTAPNHFEVSRFWNVYPVPGARVGILANAGIAFGHIARSDSNDIVVAYVDEKGRGFYKVGFSVNKYGKVENHKWSPAVPIPERGAVSMSSSVCLGVTIGDIRRRGKSDIIVAYAHSPRLTFYRYGFSLESDGKVRGGWTQNRRVYGSFGKNVSEIDVALSTTESDTELGPTTTLTHDLVIYTREQAAGWRDMLRIGANVSTTGFVTNKWSRTLPMEDDGIKSVTGGLTIGRVQGSTRPQAIVLRSVRTPDGTGEDLNYLDFGIDVLAAAKADREGMLYRKLLLSHEEGCDECYLGGAVRMCEKRFEACEAKLMTPVVLTENVDDDELREDGNSIVARSSVILRGVDRDVLTGDGSGGGGSGVSGIEHNKTIFCTGFHHFFMDDDPCSKQIRTAHVYSHGAASALLDELESALPDPEEVNLTISYDILRNDGKLYPGNDLDGKGHPKAVRITVEKKGLRGWSLRRYLIQRALTRLKMWKDFSSAYAAREWFRVDEVEAGRKFFVYIPFSTLFKKGYVKGKL